MRYLILFGLLILLLACGTTAPTVEVPPQNVSTAHAPPRDNCPDGFVRFPQGGEWACKRHNEPLAPDAETWRCPDTGYLFWVPAGQGDRSNAASSARDPQAEPKPDCKCGGYLRTTL